MIWDEYCRQYLEAMESAKQNLPEEEFKCESHWGWGFWVAEFFSVDYFSDLLVSRPEIVPDFAKISDQELQWFIDALEDERRKWFALFLIAQAKPLPEPLFPALLRAAVYENDPSLNEHFVEVASDHFGRTRIAESLFNYAEHGTDYERGHALGAVYWVLQHATIEELQSLLALLRIIAVNSRYSNPVRDQARRFYEATMQQPLEISP